MCVAQEKMLKDLPLRDLYNGTISNTIGNKLQPYRRRRLVTSVLLSLPYKHFVVSWYMAIIVSVICEEPFPHLTYILDNFAYILSLLTIPKAII